jgi:hypothetical protein
MKKLQRHEADQYGLFYAYEDGEWVATADVSELEEKVVRLEAELGSAMDCLHDELCGEDGPMTEIQIRNAGDAAVEKHRSAS